MASVPLTVHPGPELENTETKKKHCDPSERLQKTLSPNLSLVKSVAYSPDGKTFAAGTAHSIQIWSTKSGSEAVKFLLKGHDGAINALSYSPDAKHIVSGSADNTLRIWDVSTGQMIGDSLEGHTGSIFCAAYSPDGRHIVSGSLDRDMRVWDAETTKTILGPIKAHSSAVCSVAYSPNGKWIISGSWDTGLIIWDVITGESIFGPIIHPHGVWTIAYSPNGQYIAAGCNDKSIYIYDEEGKHVHEPLKGHSEVIQCVTFSPNGRYLASCSEDYTIRIWDFEIETEPIAILYGHEAAVDSITYSPDGQHIISGARDNTIRIWDAKIAPKDDLDSQFLAQDASQPPLDGLTTSVSDSSSNSSLLNMERQENSGLDDFFNIPADKIVVSSSRLETPDLPLEGPSKKNLEGSKKKIANNADTTSAGFMPKSHIQQSEENTADNLCGISELIAPARQRYEFNTLDMRGSISEDSTNKSQDVKQWNCVLCGLKIF